MLRITDIKYETLEKITSVPAELYINRNYMH